MPVAKEKNKKKKTAKSGKSTRKDGGSRGGAKFAGTVRMLPPDGGDAGAVSNGARVVVSIAELSVGRLPEGGAASELQLDALVRTTDEKGKAVAVAWSSGVYYYVRDGSTLNIAETVIFDGRVHQHLSFDFSLVEREMPQIPLKDAAAVAEAAAETAVLLAEPTGQLGHALQSLPDVLGKMLKLSGDDQVLKHTASLFTLEVRGLEDGRHRLVEGRYRLEKTRAPGDETAWVTLVLDVRGVHEAGSS